MNPHSDNYNRRTKAIAAIPMAGAIVTAALLLSGLSLISSYQPVIAQAQQPIYSRRHWRWRRRNIRRHIWRRRLIENQQSKHKTGAPLFLSFTPLIFHYIYMICKGAMYFCYLFCKSEKRLDLIAAIELNTLVCMSHRGWSILHLHWQLDYSWVRGCFYCKILPGNP